MAEENQVEDAIVLNEEEGAEVEVEDTSEDLEASSETSNEQEQVTNSAQKRINQLTKKMRDMERREQEAIRYAQQVQNESATLKQRMQTLDQGYLSEYGNRLDIETANSEALLQRAVEVGDAEKIVEAQKKLTKLYNQKEQYDQAKVQTERQQHVAQQHAQQQAMAQQQMPQQAQAQQQPDRKATQWAEKNEWFGQDEAMTFAAFGIHKRLVEEEGFDPKSDDYYTELDNRLANRFPSELGGGAKTSGTGKRNVQTVAGVSRSTTGASQSGRSKRVKLSPTQVSIAKKLGVPLEQYAKYVKE